MRRVSPGRVQYARCAHVQRRAGFDRLYPFPALRHTSVTAVYRATRDLFLAQRFARHASPLTTTVYTHPSDDEMALRVRGLRCRAKPTRSGRLFSAVHSWRTSSILPAVYRIDLWLRSPWEAVTAGG